MPRISDPPTQPVDIWTYATRTLTAGDNIILPSQAFPFTNPATAVDLPNVQMAISPTGTGREAYLDHLDMSVRQAIEDVLAKFANLLGHPRNLLDLPTPTLTLSPTGSFTRRAVLMRLENAETANAEDWALFPLGVNIANRAYIKALVRANQEVAIGFAADTDNFYQVAVVLPATAADLVLGKEVAGTYTVLASEAVDLASGTWYELEFYFDLTHNRLTVWRDGILKFDLTDTDLTTLSQFLFKNFGAGTYAELIIPLIVMWE